MCDAGNEKPKFVLSQVSKSRLGAPGEDSEGGSHPSRKSKDAARVGHPQLRVRSERESAGEDARTTAGGTPALHWSFPEEEIDGTFAEFY